MLKHHTLTLDNGLRVVTVEQPHVHSAAAALYVKCGARHESWSDWGLSHMLEHMLFRGTEKYPNSHALACAFERSGGSVDGATWKDHTSFTVTMHPSRIRQVILALADMAQTPQFVGIDSEKAIVEEELYADLDEDGRDADLDNLTRSVIWRDHPMGRRIVGSFDSIRAFQVDDLRRYHEEHYVGSNMVLCVAGPVQATDIEALAREAFSKLAPGQRQGDGEAPKFAPYHPVFTRSQEGSQLTIQLSFEALRDRHPDFATLELITRVLDDGLSSRLHQSVCERNGVYELDTALDCYSDCGLYDIAIKVAPKRAPAAIASTLETLQHIADEGISQNELDLVRERALHDIEFKLDAPDDLVHQYGVASLFGEPDSLDDEARKIKAITHADISRVANQVFRTRNVHASIVGPVEDTNLKKIQSILEAFRQ